MEIEKNEKDQHNELNKIQNWLQRSNIKIQGIPVVDTDEKLKILYECAQKNLFKGRKRPNWHY